LFPPRKEHIETIMDERHEYRPPEPPETDMIKGVILELFGRHHNAIATYIAGLIADLNAKIDHNHKELVQMSGSLADQLNAALTSITADVDAVSAEVAALLAQLQGQVGQPVTQAMVDAATGIDARLKAIPPAPTA
jgi:hypothetical protein